MKTVSFFYRQDNKRAIAWNKKICFWLKKKHSSVKIVAAKPQFLIVLGGDGTILEAARKYQSQNPIIVGLNLGRVGFLASIRKPKDFLSGLDQLLKGRYRISPRMTLAAIVIRNNKVVFETHALNEVMVQNLLGIVDIEVGIEKQPVQYISGGGVLVATASGSTGYNLSLHGPIIMPDIKCFIVTELADHNLPTPSIVVKYNQEIYVKILGFRKHELFSIAESGKKVDVILASDGKNIFPLVKNDLVVIKRSPRLLRLAELEKNYFFKSLKEKFGFK